ncbi:MAG: 5-bromo-4-chloroindolyl phosphate hydrolysis family protein [Pseudorhodobacter sp.]|nr:5-bromo-4-chloroindolyl phosphate hydrolysis family protein [Pseudorhodobacter sp.]
MAERFGGKFSPEGSVGKDHPAGRPAAARNAFDGKRRTQAGARSNLLFAAPLPFLISAFRGDPADLVLGLAAAGLLLLAAWLTREGILAQEAYAARTVARRPAFPRKIAGSVLIGAGLVLGGLMAGLSLVYPILFGIIGAGLHLLAFGPDPLADKGLAGVDTFQTDRVARAVDEAEKYLTAMKDAMLRANDRKLEARVDHFAATARALFRTVEGDPRDLTAARKYLSVYLMGARDATIKFADLYAQTRSPGTRADYESLLSDLETNFAARTQALLADNHSDLDVEIAVLRERLQFESPKVKPTA